MLARGRPDIDPMPIAILDFLDASTIDFSLKAVGKEEVIAALVEILRRAGRIQHPAALVEALLEREGLGSTGIGHGVAIPHARSGELQRTVMALGRTERPVEFDAIDGKPTRLFFLLVAPDNGGNEHLFTLAKVARLVKDPKVREQLMTLDSPQAAIDLIRGQERR
jgi:fructose-specific phosphotransferase system IIA component